MQRLYSLKVASNIPKKLSNTSTPFTLLHSHPYKPLSSITKPNTRCQNQLVNSFRSHTFHHQSHSWHSLSGGTICGFLSNPVIAKQFLLDSANTLLRFSSKSLADCRVRFLRAPFHRQSFRFNPSFYSRWRGWRSSFRGLTTDGVVYGLIMANAAVIMLWRVADHKFMRNNFMISLDNFRSGRLHTLITSAFSHFDVEHLVSNMSGLYFYGMHIGRAFGPEFLLKLYLAGALGGSIFFLVHKAFMASSSKGQQLRNKDQSNRPGLGASGAVTAIMLLDIFLFPKSTLYFNFFIPVPAILMGIFLIGKDILRIIEGDGRVSGAGHLGGAAIAAIALARIRKGRFKILK